MEEVMMNWEIFVKIHSDEGVGVVIHTPLYNWIVANFPIEAMRKLLTFADYKSEITTLLISTAVMVQDVAENRHFLEQVRRGIHIDTVEVLRFGALNFMLNTAGLTQLVQCGQALAAVLLRVALESGGEWDEFVQLLKRVFFFSDSGVLYMLLDVLCALPTELVTRFVRVLEPSILEVYALFPERMIQLLERGDDHRPYFVLANVCGLFNAPQWSIMMEAAVMSSFFKNVYSPSRRVSVASSLRICFDHDADFNFSLAMFCKMRHILTRLRYSQEPSEKHAGMELYEAFARRVLNYPIPRD